MPVNRKQITAFDYFKQAIDPDVLGDRIDQATRIRDLARAAAQEAAQKGNNKLADELNNDADMIQQMIDATHDRGNLATGSAGNSNSSGGRETEKTSSEGQPTPDQTNPQDTDNTGKGNKTGEDEGEEGTEQSQEPTQKPEDPESPEGKGKGKETAESDETEEHGQNPGQDPDDNSDLDTGNGGDGNSTPEGPNPEGSDQQDGEQREGDDSSDDATERTGSGGNSKDQKGQQKQSSSNSQGGGSSGQDGQDGSEGDDNQGGDEGDGTDDDNDFGTPKVKDKKILQNPFKNGQIPTRLPKNMQQQLDSGELEIEDELDAIVRILSGLSGEARRGAEQALRDGYNSTKSYWEGEIDEYDEENND